MYLNWTPLSRIGDGKTSWCKLLLLHVRRVAAVSRRVDIHIAPLLRRQITVSRGGSVLFFVWASEKHNSGGVRCCLRMRRAFQRWAGNGLGISLFGIGIWAPLPWGLGSLCLVSPTGWGTRCLGCVGGLDVALPLEARADWALEWVPRSSLIRAFSCPPERGPLGNSLILCFNLFKSDWDSSCLSAKTANREVLVSVDVLGNPVKSSWCADSLAFPRFSLPDPSISDLLVYPLVSVC